MQGGINNMFTPSAPNWCYFNPTSMQPSGVDQSGYLQYPAQPTYMPMPMGYSLPPTYGFVPQQQQQYYYAAAQSPGQLHPAQQQLWANNEAQLRHPNYNYWYGATAIPNGNAFTVNQSSEFIPPSSYIPAPSPPQHLHPPEAQTAMPQSNFFGRNSGGSRHAEVNSSGSKNGSLTRVTSNSSFRNDQGLRVRNSQQVMEEYLRIAARNLSTKGDQEKKEASKLHFMLQAKQQSKPDSEKNLQKKSVISQTVVIEEPLASRGDSFFKRLGLFSKKRKHRNTEPNATCSSSQESTQIKQGDTRSYRKPNFLQRVFGNNSDSNPTQTIAHSYMHKVNNSRNLCNKQSLRQDCESGIKTNLNK